MEDGNACGPDAVQELFKGFWKSTEGSNLGSLWSSSATAFQFLLVNLCNLFSSILFSTLQLPGGYYIDDFDLYIIYYYYSLSQSFCF